MAIDIGAYAKLRPMLWHLTNPENLGQILEMRELWPAADLLVDNFSRPRRSDTVGKNGTRIRNQNLLNERSVELEAWTFEEFVRQLNRRVFFWSGSGGAPVRPGKRARHQYRSDVMIRVAFMDLVQDHTPEFVKCNSGATRMQGGRPVHRGPSTFCSAASAPFGPAQVIEVTFVGRVRIPQSAEFFDSTLGEWLPLHQHAG